MFENINGSEMRYFLLGALLYTLIMYRKGRLCFLCFCFEMIEWQEIRPVADLVST